MKNKLLKAGVVLAVLVVAVLAMAGIGAAETVSTLDELKSAVENPMVTEITLGNTITLNSSSLSTIEVNRKLTLDLNGHTLKGTGKSQVINVTETGVFTLKDSASDGMITGGYANHGGGIYNAGTCIITEGKISGNASVFDGDDLYNDGTLKIGGTAKIDDVYLSEGKIITLLDGEYELKKGAKIGIDMEIAGNPFGGKINSEYFNFFVCNKQGYHFEIGDDGNVLVVKDIITHSWNGNTLKFSGDSTATVIRDDVTEALEDESAVSPYNVVISGIGGIGDYAFASCEDMESITLSDSVKVIRYGAFLGCTSLTSIAIPAGVTSIGESVFWSCSSLTSITVSPNNSVYSSENGVLFTKDKKVLVAFPCGKSGAYTIPNNVTTIGDKAFSMCKELTRVSIPVGVTSIGDNAFTMCEKLTSVSIPASVTSIGKNAFLLCTKLTSVTLPDSLTILKDGTFSACSGLTDITIPESITTIEESVFYSCSSLKSIRIPASVTSIGDSAFNVCKSLTTISIPSSVTAIGNEVFSGCSSLTEITVSPKNTAYCSIDGVLFTKDGKVLVAFPCGKSGNYTIPSGVTTINKYAFNFCKDLITVTFPDSLTSIEEWAFAHCDHLTSITIPENVTSIGSYAFYDCYQINSFQLPEGITSIPEQMISGCTSLKEIKIPDSVTSIADFAFSSCSSLGSVEFGSDSHLETVGGYAFNNIGTSVTLPVSQKAGYSFNGWKDKNGNTLEDRIITRENAEKSYHVDWGKTASSGATEKSSEMQKETKSPFPILGILAGFGAAVVLLKRRH